MLRLCARLALDLGGFSDRAGIVGAEIPHESLKRVVKRLVKWVVNGARTVERAIQVELAIQACDSRPSLYYSLLPVIISIVPSLSSSGAGFMRKDNDPQHWRVAHKEGLWYFTPSPSLPSNIDVYALHRF